jgi:DNA mismatch endonuclease (patch repair protein)
VDVHSENIRSKNMAAIKSKNTKPELKLRRALHQLGLRYRLHKKLNSLKPDLVLTKYKAAVFVHGCFWHKHACNKFSWLKTREAFWRRKLTKNQERDKHIIQSLLEDSWRVSVVWECALAGKKTPSILLQKSFVIGSLVKGLFLRLEYLNSTRTKKKLTWNSAPNQN